MRLEVSASREPRDAANKPIDIFLGKVFSKVSTGAMKKLEKD
ncbi:MAG: hypothetical protein ACTS73_03780 [Arsenophonus sp. NEOnobi-MAG3]